MYKKKSPGQVAWDSFFLTIVIYFKCSAQCLLSLCSVREINGADHSHVIRFGINYPIPFSIFVNLS